MNGSSSDQDECNVDECNAFMRENIVDNEWAFNTVNEPSCAGCPYREYKSGFYKVDQNQTAWINMWTPEEFYKLVKLPDCN